MKQLGAWKTPKSGPSYLKETLCEPATGMSRSRQPKKSLSSPGLDLFRSAIDWIAAICQNAKIGISPSIRDQGGFAEEQPHGVWLKKKKSGQTMQQSLI